LFAASQWAPELKRVDPLAAEWTKDIELIVSEDGDIKWKGALFPAVAYGAGEGAPTTLFTCGAYIASGYQDG
jgi:hypothetical protein